MPLSSRSTDRLALGALLLMAMLWGSTFFSIKDLVTRVPVPDMLAIRFVIATVVLIAVAPKHLRMSRATCGKGIVLGLLFGSAQISQTFGLAHTAASISGFITGLYVVFTPVLGALIFGSRIRPLVWAAVAMATVGLGVLSLQTGADGVSIGGGAAVTAVSALLYASHIVALGRWSTLQESMSLTFVQSIVVTLMCFVAAAPGGISLPTGGVDWAMLLYLAIICGSIPFFLQIWAQAHVEPTRAAVIMSTEPVWAAFFAVLLGGESLTWRLAMGGVAILVAMYTVIRAPEAENAVREEPASAPGAHP